MKLSNNSISYNVHELAPWGGVYLDAALISVLATCILTPTLIRSGMISNSMCAYLKPLWPINYVSARQLTALGATGEYVNSVTTAASIAVVISTSYFIARLGIEYWYDCRKVLPLYLYAACTVLGLFACGTYLTRTNFGVMYENSLVSFHYDPVVNSLIICNVILGTTIVASESISHAIRYVRVLAGGDPLNSTKPDSK